MLVVTVRGMAASTRTRRHYRKRWISIAIMLLGAPVIGGAAPAMTDSELRKLDSALNSSQFADPAKAAALAERLVIEAKRANAPRYVAAALLTQGNLARLRQDLVGAERLYREAERWAARARDPGGVADARYNIGTLLYYKGDYVGTHASYVQGIRVREAAGLRDSDLATMYGNLASLLIELGNPREASRALERSITVAPDQLSPTDRGLYWGRRGKLAAARDDQSAALAYFTRARAEMVGQDDYNVACIDKSLAETLEALGRLSEARTAARRSIAALAGGGPPACSAKLVLATVSERLGDQDAARLWGERALADARAGTRNTLAQAHALLSHQEEGRGRLQEALTHERAAAAALTEQLGESERRAIAGAQIRFGTQERERDIVLLKAARDRATREQRALRWRLVTASVAIAALAALAALLFRSQRRLRAMNVALARSRDELARALSANALLLRELNHRVRNNLQLIASMLNIQARALRAGERDSAGASALVAVRNRVDAMALVHGRLLERDLPTVAMRSYLVELVARLADVWGEGAATEVEVDAVELDADVAIPIGLIVSELVCNAFEHGTRPGRQLAVAVRLEAAGPDFRLSVRDDGPGGRIGEGVSMGLSIVRDLARQLGGELAPTAGLEGTGVGWTVHVRAASLATAA